MLGGRPLSMVAREALAPANYRALWRMRRVYPAFATNARRYFLGSGAYPYRCEIRTPAGLVAPTLHSHHDMWTVNEVFCREDYATGAGARVVVDVGSNIGISALYFLTRHPDLRCHCFEPVPANAQRLRANLAGFEGRFTFERVAVADREGSVPFGVEPSGRYGGIGVATGTVIDVSCREVNGVLADVLSREGFIDVLKVDTEGAEADTVAAIAPEHLDRIGRIFLEVERPVVLHPDRFDARFANQTLALVNRAPQRA